MPPARKPDHELQPAYLKKREYYLRYRREHSERANELARARRLAAGKIPRGPYKSRISQATFDDMDLKAMRDPIIANGRESRNAQAL